jgi:hypothetical protein
MQRSTVLQDTVLKVLQFNIKSHFLTMNFNFSLTAPVALLSALNVLPQTENCWMALKNKDGI